MWDVILNFLGQVFPILEGIMLQVLEFTKMKKKKHLIFYYQQNLHKI